MTTNDESDFGWDSLAEELGIKNETPEQPAAKPAATPRPAAKPALLRRQEVPEPEGDEFGFTEEPDAPEPPTAALYDPGPDLLGSEDDELEEVASDEDAPFAEEITEGQDGAKKKRRRRRRKKKGAPATDGAEKAAPVADEEDSIVEQGEAPAEVEDDDEEDEEMAPSLIDEEMDEEAAGPRPEWHVMTWMDLVSKLHRPG